MRAKFPAMTAPSCLALLGVALCIGTAGAARAEHFRLSSATGDLHLSELLAQSGRHRRGADEQADTIALDFVVNGEQLPTCLGTL